MDFRCLSQCEVLGRSYVCKEQIKMTFKKAVRGYAAGGRRERQPLKTPSVPARIHRGPGTIRVSARCDRSRF